MTALVSIFIVLLLSGCSSEPPRENSIPRALSFKTIVHDGYSFQYDKPWTFAIQDEEDEAGFRLTSRATIDFPKIDYNNYTVVCLLLGKHDSPGAAITIDSVVQYPQVVRVFSHQSQSTDGIGAPNYPAQIIVLEKIRTDVEFKPDPLANSGGRNGT